MDSSVVDTVYVVSQNQEGWQGVVVLLGVLVLIGYFFKRMSDR